MINLVKAIMIKILSNTSSFLTRNPCNFYLFSKDKERKKIQTVGFSNNHIENVKSLSYKYKEPIKFTDGRFLIYRSKPSIFRTLRNYLFHIVGISLFGFLIYIRYNMETYPVVFHGYVAGIAVILVLFMRKYLKNQNIVKEIYLREGGKATEIVFQNQLKRKLFREPLQSTYYNSLFVPPKETEENWKILSEFPKDLKSAKMKGQFGSYWKKQYSNQGNLLLIPKKYEYMHIELLNQVMNGKVINCW